MIHTKRVYEKPAKEDGFRILVDRLWPRGLTKEKAQVDLWIKEIAPSDELRKWFHHGDREWPEFVKRYRKELTENNNQVTFLRKLAKAHKTVTLLFGSKDQKQNQAVVLASLLKGK